MITKHKCLEPIHPDEILLEDFMKPVDICNNRLAREIASASTSVSCPTHGWVLQTEHEIRIAQLMIVDEVDKRVQGDAA